MTFATLTTCLCLAAADSPLTTQAVYVAGGLLTLVVAADRVVSLVRNLRTDPPNHEVYATKEALAAHAHASKAAHEALKEEMSRVRKDLKDAVTDLTTSMKELGGTMQTLATAMNHDGGAMEATAEGLKERLSTLEQRVNALPPVPGSRRPAH